MYTYLHKLTHTYTNSYTYTIHTPSHTYTHTAHTYTPPHTYAHTCTHTHTHKHTHQESLFHRGPWSELPSPESSGMLSPRQKRRLHVSPRTVSVMIVPELEVVAGDLSENAWDSSAREAPDVPNPSLPELSGPGPAPLPAVVVPRPRPRRPSRRPHRTPYSLQDTPSVGGTLEILSLLYECTLHSDAPWVLTVSIS